jgi:hypothetical protein
LATLGQQNAFNSTSASITCQVLVAHIQYADGVDDQMFPDMEYICLPVDSQDGFVYQIPTSLLQGNATLYQNGDAIIEIFGGQAVQGNGNSSNYEIVLAENSYVTLIETLSDRRATAQAALPAPKIGTRTALIVRVTAVDNKISLDATTISEQVFGTGFSLQTVYGNCSWGQLKFAPVTGPKINHGVLEMSVNISTYNASRLTIENAMTIELSKVVGSTSQWDHILFCVPQPSATWIAYAYVGGNK